MGDGGPGRLELGAESKQSEDGVVLALGEELPQELQGGRVRPVQVLDNEQDRPPGGAVCSHSNRARNVSSLCRAGGSDDGGKRSVVGSDSSAAHSGTVSGRSFLRGELVRLVLLGDCPHFVFVNNSPPG